jgi:hypothetical protein
MADRPILFSGPMVRALLAGTKTQTRRVMKPQPFESGYFDGEIELTVIPANDQWPKAFRFNASAVGGDAILGEIYEPRISIGDRLYVREHWRTHAMFDDIAPRDLQARSVHYCADGGINSGKHRQAMHMPRWASRLTLTVTDVRVERLQDITLRDAFAEGCQIRQIDLFGAEGEMRDNIGRAYYRRVWEGINGAGSWNANPWVVAYSFSVERQNIDLIERAV